MGTFCTFVGTNPAFSDGLQYPLGYARVSIEDQSLALPHDALRRNLIRR